VIRQTHWSRPRWAPGPWAPAHGQVLPTQFRTLSPQLVRSHAFPRQGRPQQIAAMTAVVDRRGAVDPNIMFMPRESVQGYGSGPNALNAVARAEARMSGLQARVLAKYMGGQALTPPEVQELMRMRAPQTPQWTAWARAQNRRAGGPPAGAHQIPPYPRGPGGAQALIRCGQRRAFAYGACGPTIRRPELAPVRNARAAMLRRMGV